MGERFDGKWRVLLFVAFLVGGVVPQPLRGQEVSGGEAARKIGEEDGRTTPAASSDPLAPVAVADESESEEPALSELELEEATPDGDAATKPEAVPAEGGPLKREAPKQEAPEEEATETKAIPVDPLREAGPDSIEEAQEEGPQLDSFEIHAVPGEHHEHLAAAIGSWNVVMKVWHSPESPAMELFGTFESHWILDGRFVETRFHGQFMGQAIDGLGIDGYDNQKQRYVGTWRDTLGTNTMTFEGDCEADGAIRTMVADFVDPESGKAMTNKGVTTIVDDDTYRYESFLMEKGSEVEFKNLELTARRQ
ncbi:MAG: DUF1579 family protein [Deltaproteobacteria bacterium]|nr:DUF1579 family protein [Deltaproteobacteria bacterium]